jgi:hypothetical protein
MAAYYFRWDSEYLIVIALIKRLIKLQLYTYNRPSDVLLFNSEVSFAFRIKNIPLSFVSVVSTVSSNYCE